MVFYVTCECGSSVCTDIIHAGSSVKCPDCGKSVKVPSSNRLQDSNGEPLWTPLQLTAIACANSTDPFSGVCHVCEEIQANKKRDATVLFQASKHFVSPESATELPNVTLSATPFSSSIGKLEFPLLFCDECSTRFARNWKIQSAKSFSEIVLMGTAVTICFTVLVVLALLLPILSVPMAIGLVGKLIADQKKIKPDQFLNDHLKDVKWIGDAVQNDPELQIKVGAVKEALS